MTTDPIVAARALLDKVPPLFIDLDGDLCREGDGYNLVGCAATDDEPPFGPLNPVIWSAIPILRDMVATLADALEAERAKVAAAYEAAISACGNNQNRPLMNAHQKDAWDRAISDTRNAIRALTLADAQAALDKMLSEARLEGWRAGRDAAADAMQPALRSMLSRGQAAAAILALPEPKETSHD